MSSYTSGWTLSGTSIDTTSAAAAASVGVATVSPSARAALREDDPSRRPTITSTPLSARFCAWACPWLP